MEMSKETQESISKLQILEQNMQGLNLQKQQFQSQLTEAENALSEIEKVKTAYKVVGNIMVESSSSDIKKDLEEKKELLNLRIKSLDKQESELKKQANEIQQKVMKELKR